MEKADKICVLLDRVSHVGCESEGFKGDIESLNDNTGQVRRALGAREHTQRRQKASCAEPHPVAGPAHLSSPPAYYGRCVIAPGRP